MATNTGCRACAASDFHVTTTPAVRLDGARILLALGSEKDKEHRSVGLSLDPCAALEVIDALAAALKALPGNVIEEAMHGKGHPKPYLPRPVGYGMDGGGLDHWASCKERRLSSPPPGRADKGTPDGSEEE